MNVVINKINETNIIIKDTLKELFKKKGGFPPKVLFFLGEEQRYFS